MVPALGEETGIWTPQRPCGEAGSIRGAGCEDGPHDEKSNEMNTTERSVQLNSGREIRILESREVRLTPYSLFLLEHLPCPSPDAVVIDYGVGTGLQAIALALAGAGRVLGVDINKEALALCRANCEQNQAAVELCLGREEMRGKVAPASVDLIVCNPASLPAQEQNLSPFFQAGEEGNAMILELIAVAEQTLKPGGRLLFIHTSLVPLADTLARLEQSGFAAGIVRIRALAFRDFYFKLLPHWRNLLARGRSFYLVRQGQYYEILYLIEAQKIGPTKGGPYSL